MKTPLIICFAIAAIGLGFVIHDLVKAEPVETPELMFETTDARIVDFQLQDMRQLVIEGGYQESYERLFSMLDELIASHPVEMRNLFLSKHITYYGINERCVGFRCRYEDQEAAMVAERMVKDDR